jgi:hypothetical protein
MTPMVLSVLGGTPGGLRAPLRALHETNSERIMAAASGERRIFANQRELDAQSGSIGNCKPS